MSSLKLDINPPIARLTLVRDVIGAAEIAELASACEAIAGDDNVRVVVLAGGGDSFGRGWDWPVLAAESPDAAAALQEAGVLDDPFGCLAALPKAVVCALHGEVSGGGLALALAADIRIAAEDATFSLPETRMGLVPMAGATQRLARLTGRGAALALVLSGEPIDAGDALRIGIVSEVVPKAALAERADAIAGRIAERGPIAVQYAKEAVSRGAEMPLDQGLRYETDLTMILQTTEDRAEGVRAFLEKRQPKFKGK
ncbi:MAG: enoyl-CoA hydratase/isomerase family protein [Chloroflexi bacterium]|nr:enoyl-CoA hydratase/isomerase family protein [Chloroflexota bacterium]